MPSESKTVLTREDLVTALYGYGRTGGCCAGEVCPLFSIGGPNCMNNLRLLAAYMLEHDLVGLTKEQIEEALNHGNA